MLLLTCGCWTVCRRCYGSDRRCKQHARWQPVDKADRCCCSCRAGITPVQGNTLRAQHGRVSISLAALVCAREQSLGEAVISSHHDGV
jgi:hypothetical protein